MDYKNSGFTNCSISTIIIGYEKKTGFAQNRRIRLWITKKLALISRQVTSQ